MLNKISLHFNLDQNKKLQTMIVSTQSPFWFSWDLSLFTIRELKAFIFCFIFCLKTLQYFFWVTVTFDPKSFLH